MVADVVIPAFNEEESISLVINDIPKTPIRDIIVVNNGSNDATAKNAEKVGAIVVNEPQKGYGAACLKGIAKINENTIPPDIVVFVDGDYSDHPEELTKLLIAIENGADMAIGSRALGNREKGAMMPQQVFGNWLATKLIKLLYGYQYSDLGPFRAITYPALQKIGMKDTNFGWTVEMQIKVLKHKLKVAEIPVSYRKRIGVSKITGTLRGTLMAGYKIIYTIIKYRNG